MDKPARTPEEVDRLEQQGATAGRRVGIALAIAGLLAMALIVAAGMGLFDQGDPIEQAIEDDATCAELFDIRNDADPDDPRVGSWNRQLREVGCFSSGSTRTD